MEEIIKDWLYEEWTKQQNENVIMIINTLYDDDKQRTKDVIYKTWFERQDKRMQELIEILLEYDKQRSDGKQ